MKDLLKNIWTAPGWTLAGALSALGIWLASDQVNAPDYVSLPAAGLAVFLGAFYNPQSKPPTQ